MGPPSPRRSGRSTPTHCAASDRWRRLSSGIRIFLPWPSYCVKRRRPHSIYVRVRLSAMLTLRELQSLFRSAVCGVEMPQLLGIIAADGLAPAARLHIYRHHVLTSLTEALQATFPVVCCLVDARFFGYAADTYIRHY